jgi:DNA-binding GntR family transcriptional regulator
VYFSAEMTSESVVPNHLTPRDPSLSEKVLDRLRRAVLDAEFSLGERLSEEKLAAALGVSRTPVRDALNALQQEGLIEVKPQRGSFVFLASDADLELLCQFRQMIEVQALRLCFLHRREATLAQMRQASAEMEIASRNGDLLASARADTAFHDALLVNCTNHYFQSSYRLVSGKIAALRAHRSSLDTRSGVNNEHQRIIDAFERGDLTQAEAILTEHILKMRDRYRFEVDPVHPTRVGKRRQGAVGVLRPLT